MNTCLKARRRRSAFSLTELFAVILVLMVALIFFLPNFGHRGPIANCALNLKTLGAAFHAWANEHGGRLPMQVSTNDGGSMEFAASGDAFPHLRVLAKELQAPNILICPADENRQVTTNFALLSNAHVSYFVGLNAAMTNLTSSSTNYGKFLAGDRNLTFDGRVVKAGLLVVPPPDNMLSWAKKIHHRHGNILFEDGAVELMNTPRLKHALEKVGGVTNRFAIP